MRSIWALLGSWGSSWEGFFEARVSYSFLGQACGPCQIQYGAQCVVCPDGSNMPECYGCVAGVKVKADEPWFDKKDITSAVVTGVITALVVGYITKRVKV